MLQTERTLISQMVKTFLPYTSLGQMNKILIRLGLVDNSWSWMERIVSALKDFIRLILVGPCYFDNYADANQSLLSKIDPMPNIFGREKLRKNNAIGMQLVWIFHFNSQCDQIDLEHVARFQFKFNPDGDSATKSINEVIWITVEL